MTLRHGPLAYACGFMLCQRRGIKGQPGYKRAGLVARLLRNALQGSGRWTLRSSLWISMGIQSVDTGTTSRSERATEDKLSEHRQSNVSHSAPLLRGRHSQEGEIVDTLLEGLELGEWIRESLLKEEEENISCMKRKEGRMCGTMLPSVNRREHSAAFTVGSNMENSTILTLYHPGCWHLRETKSGLRIKPSSNSAAQSLGIP